MIYNNVRHECNLYNFFFAPRGNRRMMELGRKISQMYLNPFDRIIGIIGAKDSGKSMICLLYTSNSSEEYEKSPVRAGLFLKSVCYLKN